MRITAQLVDVATDQHLWAERYEVDLSDVLRILAKVAQAIARETRSELTAQERVHVSTFEPINAVAHEAYLRGRYFWAKRTADSLGKAIEYFSKATEIDPNYALAYAGLADSYGALAVNSDTAPKDLFPKAKAMAKKALQLDGTVAEAHASLGYALTYFDWDWSGAEREFTRAIELNPNYALARQWRAAFLSAMGRHAEAIAEAKRAQELDPLSLIVGSIAGRCLYHARRYDEAIQQYQKTLEIDSNFWVAHLFLGKALGQKGMFEQALAELRKAGSVTTEGLSWIGHVHAVQGNSAAAHRVLDELQALAGRRYVPSCHIARIYAGLGDREQAFAWLQRACEERATRLAHLKVEPTFDPLRSDPRFADLLRCVGLSP